MALNKNIKNILWKITWTVIGCAIVFILITAFKKNENSVCKNVLVHILSNKDQLFLNEKDIFQLINANDIKEKKKINEIDIKLIEQQLEKNVWIQNAEVYLDRNNIMNVEVVERTPLFRIFRKDGNSFFMDKNKIVLPISYAYSAKVPIFTGFSNSLNFSKRDTQSIQSIEKMANFITKDTFWMAQIQQLNIINNEEFELVPTFGNHIVVFGDTVQMESKFHKLFTFYKKVLSKVGFDKYATLNLKFKNQIVATNNKDRQIDTSKVSLIIQNFLKNSGDSSMQFADSVSANPAIDTMVIPTKVVVTKPASKPKIASSKPKSTLPATKPSTVKQKPIVPKPKVSAPVKSKPTVNSNKPTIKINTQQKKQ